MKNNRLLEDPNAAGPALDPNAAGPALDDSAPMIYTRQAQAADAAAAQAAAQAADAAGGIN